MFEAPINFGEISDSSPIDSLELAGLGANASDYIDDSCPPMSKDDIEPRGADEPVL